METDNSNRLETRRKVAASLAEERRDQARGAGPFDVVIEWHHQAGVASCYEAIDVSEVGLRVRATTILPEGMTGRAYFAADGGPENARPAMIAWCRPVRDEDDNITHYEAGVRLFNLRESNSSG